jgi:hypothetical protein
MIPFSGLCWNKKEDDYGTCEPGFQDMRDKGTAPKNLMEGHPKMITQ